MTDTGNDAMRRNSALAPLLRWAEPIIAPARDNTLRHCREMCTRAADHFDGNRLAESAAIAFATPALFWSARTLLLELAIARHQSTISGDTPEQRFAHFVEWIDSASGRRAIDARYPLLAGDVARHAAQTEAFLARFMQRIDADFATLAALFPAAAPPGRLCAFSLGQGDRHDHGGSVVKLDFENGRALYKPRSLAMDTAYAGFVQHLFELEVAPAQKAAAALDRGAYGYAAWVEHAPAADAAAIARYYERYGGVVAIAYLLNCTDLHLENLIAAGEYPVLIDLETLLQPQLGRRRQDQALRVPHAPSILFSSLLPGQLSEQEMGDLSGLAWQEHRYPTRVAAAAGTDQLRLAPSEGVLRPSTNVPFLADGRRMPVSDYGDAIVGGFEKTYRGLQQIKRKLAGDDGLLAIFSSLETRTVLRSTQIYARLLDALSHPQYLRSAEDREAVLARLEVGARERPMLARTQTLERAALARGDVPRFLARVDGVDIRDGDGDVVAAFCERSGWQEAQRRVRGLSARDLKRQRYALAQALECVRSSRPPGEDGGNARDPRRTASSVRAFSGGTFLKTATRIGDDLLDLSFRDGRGIVFFQPEYGDGERASMIGMGATLYEGMPGVALLFAELGQSAGMARFTRAATALLDSSRDVLHSDAEALPSAGAFTGLAGWIYVLLALGVRWRREDLVDEAVACLPRLAERIEAEDAADVLGGVAGALLVLLELQRHRPQRDVMSVAAACAIRLAATAQRDADGAFWLSAQSPAFALTGFAHGSAGIAGALARYGERAGDAECIELARAALRYERAAFARRGERWNDRIGDPARPPDARCDDCSWCHGAPGVGLARLLWPASLRDRAWHTELAHCVAATRARGLSTPDTPSHALCHGQLGNLELLLQAACLDGTRSALSACRADARALLERARDGWRCGGASTSQAPLGLMIGMAGIAYACLRLADPIDVPAVLSLSVPALSTCG